VRSQIEDLDESILNLKIVKKAKLDQQTPRPFKRLKAERASATKNKKGGSPDRDLTAEGRSPSKAKVSSRSPSKQVMHEKAKRTTQNLDTTPGLIQQDVESNYENNRKQFEKYRSAHEQMDAYSQRRSYSTLLLKQSQNKAGLATQRDESMFQYGNKNSRLEKSNRDQGSDI
jgi:hypothetical protein